MLFETSSVQLYVCSLSKPEANEAPFKGTFLEPELL